MKRIIPLAMVLVMMLVSIGGCWVGPDQVGRGGEHRKGDGYNIDSDGGPEPDPRFKQRS